jgi:hypothetical protein
MKKKSAYFILTVFVALAALFVARQRTLNALCADNDSLRKQVELEKSAREAAVREPSAEPAAKLNDADEKELLQLRAKIVPLRQQLRDTSSRVVILQRPRRAGAPAAPPSSK